MIFSPIRVLDLELDRPIADIEGLYGYGSVRLLVRDGGFPVGTVDVPVRAGVCPADEIRTAVARAGLAPGAAPARPAPVTWPRLAVAVCTRGRPDDLALCLRHLTAVDYDTLEVLVVDNAPADDVNAVICAAYPQVRRVVEERPGLNHARNRAIAETDADILAFLDDDAVADRGWARALTAPFALNRDVAAVTGLVVPYELETAAQLHFERYGGFGCGFSRRRFDWSASGPRRHEMMECGTGANMAFRRSIFQRTGPFDPALDAGTPTGGGGDIDMFFRVLHTGGVIVYEPAALVRHVHRRDDAELRRQIASWGSGMVAVFARNAEAYPAERGPLLRLGVRGVLHNVVQLGRSLLRPPGYPRSLLLAQLRGSIAGIGRYRRARAAAGPAGREAEPR
jgi:O-antigen biosynthesis protein